jgi:hypothetical protein
MILLYYESKHVNYTRSDDFSVDKKWESHLSRKIPLFCSLQRWSIYRFCVVRALKYLTIPNYKTTLGLIEHPYEYLWAKISFGEAQNGLLWTPSLDSRNDQKIHSQRQWACH